MRLNRRWLGRACLQGRVPLAVASLLVLGAMCLRLGPGTGRVPLAVFQNGPRVPSFLRNTPSLDATQVRAAYGHLPLIFEANRGQNNPAVKFLARGSGYELFLTANQAVLALQLSPVSRQSAPPLSVLSVGLAQANPHAEVNGVDQLPGKSNYFIGNDPAQWHRDIPQYSRVRYGNVYPGIDLVYYGNRGRLESDFVVAPGSDPRQVALHFGGTDRLRIDPAGNLVLSIRGGDVILQAPRVYQRFGEEERTVPGWFELRGQDEAGFALGDYDRSRTLIIDPVLTYSTFLGGSKDEGCSVILGTGTPVAGCPAIAVDTAFNAYIAGSTTSVDFPTSGSPFQLHSKGSADVFVAKFNNTATILEFATYLGGSGVDTTVGVAVDPGFNVIVAGNTLSANFPAKNGFQSVPLNAQNHVFVSQLDPNGKNLLYSTYLSGNGTDTATGLALDPSGNAYVIGTTTSKESQTGFPSTLGAIQASSRAPNQFFVTKVDPTLSGAGSVAYSTYFGGSTPSNGETKGGGIAVDVNSNVYITGGTDFTNMPVLNASQGTLAGGLDAFVAKLNPAATAGTQLLYSTYLGGSTGDDIGYGIAVDSSSAYVVGSTSSTDFPAAGTGSLQSANGGGVDAFLAKLANPVTTTTTPGSVTLSYSTYLGGSDTDVALGVAVDTNQGAHIVGWTNSPNFPLLNNPVQSGLGGKSDAFVARVDTTATTSTAPGHYSTFLGGIDNDYGTGIAIDTQGAVYVSGETASSNLLTQAQPETNSFQPTLNGGTDAFVSKLGPVVSLGLSVIPSPTVVGVGNQVSYVYTITNNGDFTNGVTFTDTISPNTTFVSATASPGSCGGAATSIVGCTIGTMDAGATGTVTVILTPVPSLTPSTTPLQLPNSASVTVLGCSLPSCSASAETSVQVNDFTLTVAPATASVPAGVPATYTATVTPTGAIPSSVTFACAGLPAGGTCTETTNPIPNLSNGAASTVLVINTVARVTTTTDLWRKGGPIYALWLPIPGLVLLGVGIGGVSRKRRWLMAVLLSVFFALILFQPACSSTKTTTTTTGTPAGTYVVTVSATSGATRNATVTLVVQ
ncbi:MAG: SBBP repeat-containing protein [Terriglobales bacterium]